MDTHSIQQFLSTTATELGVKILAAIAFWIVGRWLIVRVAREAGWPAPTPSQIIHRA